MNRILSNCIVFIAICLLQSCVTNTKLVEEKCDVALINELNSMQSSEQISVSIICSTKLSETMADQLKSTGAKVNSIVGKIATVKANKSQIVHLSNLEIVEKLQGNKQFKPIIRNK